jgi:hypothetical protein
MGWAVGRNVRIDYRWSDDIDVRLVLDRAARHERDQRRRGSAAEQSDSPRYDRPAASSSCSSTAAC